VLIVDHSSLQLLVGQIEVLQDLLGTNLRIVLTRGIRRD